MVCQTARLLWHAKLQDNFGITEGMNFWNVKCCVKFCMTYIKACFKPKESESESEIFYSTIIHVQFITKVINLLKTKVKDVFC